MVVGKIKAPQMAEFVVVVVNSEIVAVVKYLEIVVARSSGIVAETDPGKNPVFNLQKEHLAIREKKKPEDPIDLNDLKSMRFTRAVIFETSRLATIVNGVLRKTTKDMELNGEFGRFQA
ncbi:hypothetical protein F8388_022501 [Cannabis sativa]|uniref:Uncharacterized protein n=1 Tax=Cannabis sativa TaxID=3483 RepID=A0A7J6EWP7_CANSA|nr:hypothetical protein F8388_022501 [Cannabis sativa]